MPKPRKLYKYNLLKVFDDILKTFKQPVKFTKIIRKFEELDLSHEAIIALLTEVNANDFTPLNSFIMNKNKLFLKLYMHIAPNYLENEKMTEMLTKPNRFGFNPLQQALKTGDLDIIRDLLLKLNENLSASEIKHELLLKNFAGYNSLHQVCQNNSLEAVKIYIDFVKNTIGSDAPYILHTLAHDHANSGNTPKPRRSNRDYIFLLSLLNNLKKDPPVKSATPDIEISDPIQLLPMGLV